jgi:hypothetical protein
LAASWSWSPITPTPSPIQVSPTLERGNYSRSESVLLKALEVDPGYTEAHYVLGFVYTVGPFPDPEAAREHWQRVVDLEPGSERAQITQVHLDQMEEESAPR